MPLPHRPAVLLELDLTRGLIELEPDDPIGKLTSRGRPRLRTVLRTLHEAGADRRVGGLVVKVGGRLPLALAQELRDGLRAFAGSGKPAIAWAETFGDSGNGTVNYLLATGLPEVWLQPSGELGLLGLAAEVTFLRGALDKLGIEPQLQQRHEFKNAADALLRSEFSPAHREAADRLVASAWEQVSAAIAAARGVPVADVQAAADSGPLLPAEARTRRLIDRVGYRDEVYAELRQRLGGLGGGVRLLFASQWSPRRRPVHAVRTARQPVVALVEGVGEIVPGRSRRGGLAGRRMGSDTVSAALRAAREDDKVAAVLFRVDSPGGSAVASDTIWREVCLTRDAGKPVVVSMGALAGSGGYYIACPADVIVAQPGTLTGSIGVLGGKPVIADLLDRLGVTTGAVQRGERARMYSLRRQFGQDEWARLGALMDAVYEDFVAKVAQGRRMSRDAVHEVARGRVWTGADAAANGLVDELGGLRRAARIARERAGLPADARVRPAVHIPLAARLTPPRNSEDPRAARIGVGWGSSADLAAALQLPAPLRMPGIRLAG